MKSAIGPVTAALLLGTLQLACGGLESDGGAAVTSDDTQVTEALRRGRRWTPPRPATTTGAAGGSGASAPAPTPAAPTATGDVSAAIAAAQTADGRAIPQPAGPNGACPEVLVLLGFWSCPSIDETCAYTSAGVHHDCRCSRADGEGQNPAWVCDQ
jgi:hypothetical protein